MKQQAILDQNKINAWAERAQAASTQDEKNEVYKELVAALVASEAVAEFQSLRAEGSLTQEDFYARANAMVENLIVQFQAAAVDPEWIAGPIPTQSLELLADTFIIAALSSGQPRKEVKTAGVARGDDSGFAAKVRAEEALPERNGQKR